MKERPARSRVPRRQPRRRMPGVNCVPGVIHLFSHARTSLRSHLTQPDQNERFANSVTRRRLRGETQKPSLFVTILLRPTVPRSAGCSLVDGSVNLEGGEP
jgi:hypothetical protein